MQIAILLALQQDDRQAKVCLLSPLYGNDDHHGDKVTAKPYLQRKYVHETRNVILHDRIRLIFHTRYDGVKGEGERRWRTLMQYDIQETHICVESSGSK